MGNARASFEKPRSVYVQITDKARKGSVTLTVYGSDRESVVKEIEKAFGAKHRSKSR